MIARPPILHELTWVKATSPRRWLARSALAMAVLAGPLGGCTIVKPWQRGRLGHPAMQLDGRLGSAMRHHVLAIREGSVGGEGASGGGCGCN